MLFPIRGTLAGNILNPTVPSALPRDVTRRCDKPFLKTNE